MKKQRRRSWNGDWFRWGLSGYARRANDSYAGPDDPDALPGDWYDATKGRSQLPHWPPDTWAYFRTAFGAFDAAALGFVQLPVGRRAELLSSGEAT